MYVINKQVEQIKEDKKVQYQNTQQCNEKANRLINENRLMNNPIYSHHCLNLHLCLAHNWHLRLNKNLWSYIYFLLRLNCIHNLNGLLSGLGATKTKAHNSNSRSITSSVMSVMRGMMEVMNCVVCSVAERLANMRVANTKVVSSGCMVMRCCMVHSTRMMVCGT
ncbi:Hypothetical_protein [Hexamita inflata]|uniref:Hypothetical_protein n=1 Tax=Hexamita inflata TaxID=28002 RepID=A0AA86NWD1_9EUKA|nr:Hypothetical protein HINF_LOCUS15055 [Hexamita inflata]